MTRGALALFHVFRPEASRRQVDQSPTNASASSRAANVIATASEPDSEYKESNGIQRPFLIAVNIPATDVVLGSRNLTVHEWGTFTSVAGDGGQAVEWLPVNRQSDLPCFVNQEQTVLKDYLFAKVRMETPVLNDRLQHPPPAAGGNLPPEDGSNDLRSSRQ